MAEHRLTATPDTVRWGFLDAATPPALTVASGDVVTVETVSGGPDHLPPPGFHVPPEMHAIHARAERMLPGHILTGPVAVEGAMPGDVLEVRIRAIDLRCDWGWNMIRPPLGALPDDFDTGRVLTMPLDLDRRVAPLPWGGELPLAPFFGVMGVAPPAERGRVTSLVPGDFGGNLDLKELVPGARLFLPVLTPGANFSCGDGHAAQGDGEVCVTAIETGLRGTFELILRRDLSLTAPRAETPTHLIALGLDPDLNRAMEQALRAMIRWLGESAGMAAADAYSLCSLAADLRITQVVNQTRGVHCMLPRAVLPPGAAAAAGFAD
ncbi:MAG: acetamidase/formamidase family protein [Pseudomonadota bacterium]|nr:acetamidase/formamidase family protein [Pseudomonadota bacterium]